MQTPCGRPVKRRRCQAEEEEEGSIPDVVIGRASSAAVRRVMVFNTYRALTALAAVRGPSPDVAHTCGFVAAAQQALIFSVKVQCDRTGQLVNAETLQPVPRRVAVKVFTDTAWSYVNAAGRSGCIPSDLLQECLDALRTCKLVQRVGLTVRTALQYCSALVSQFVRFSETYTAGTHNAGTHNAGTHNAGTHNEGAAAECVTAVEKALHDLWRVLPTTHKRDDDAAGEGSAGWDTLPAWEQELRLLDGQFFDAHEDLHAHLRAASAAAAASEAAAAA